MHIKLSDFLGLQGKLKIYVDSHNENYFRDTLRISKVLGLRGKIKKEIDIWNIEYRQKFNNDFKHWIKDNIHYWKDNQGFEHWIKHDIHYWLDDEEYVHWLDENESEIWYEGVHKHQYDRNNIYTIDGVFFKRWDIETLSWNY